MLMVLFPYVGITRIRLKGYNLSPYFRAPLSNNNICVGFDTDKDSSFY